VTAQRAGGNIVGVSLRLSSSAVTAQRRAGRDIYSRG